MLGKRKNKAWIEPLRAIALFRDCSDRQLARIDGFMTEVEVPAGTALVHEGLQGLEFFIIRDGKAVVTQAGEIINGLAAGDFFGELSLLDRAPRSASVTAATDMRLWVLSRREFFAVLDELPALARLVRETAEDRRQPSYTTTPRTFLPAARSSKASLIPSNG